MNWDWTQVSRTIGEHYLLASDKFVKIHNSFEVLLDLCPQAKSIMCEGKFFSQVMHFQQWEFWQSTRCKNGECLSP